MFKNYVPRIDELESSQKLESLKDFETNIFAQTKIRANHSVVSELMELEEYRKNNEMLLNSQTIQDQTVQEAHFNELQVRLSSS